MKKIIIVSDSLRVGGIQRSLRTFLDNLNYNEYDITLFLFNDRYPEDLPTSIHLLKSNFFLRSISLTLKEAKSENLLVYFVRIFLAFLCKVLGSEFVYSTIFLFTKNIKYYDIALSYSNNGNNRTVYYGYNKFVLNKVKADRKITYLHVDYEIMRLNNKTNRNEYSKFDKILTVSEYTKRVFIKCNKDLEKKVEVVYNFLPNNINNNLKNPYNYNGFIIVSVGRLDDNKNPGLQVEIAKELKNRNLQFKWYLIGDGVLRKAMEVMVKRESLNDCVFFLGSKEDAYSYIKYANAYVSTSKSESYGLSIAEALLLNTVVVAKEYPALHEIINTDNGFICEDKEKMIYILTELITIPNLYNDAKKKAILNFDNQKNYKKLKSVLEGE